MHPSERVGARFRLLSIFEIPRVSCTLVALSLTSLYHPPHLSGLDNNRMVSYLDRVITRHFRKVVYPISGCGEPNALNLLGWDMRLLIQTSWTPSEDDITFCRRDSQR